MENSNYYSNIISIEKARKILNKGGEFYTDEEIKLILPFMEHWAKINARVIIKEANKIMAEKHQQTNFISKNKPSAEKR